MSIFRLRCRQERIALPVWVLVIAGLLVMTASALAAGFPTAQARASLLQLALATPVLRMFRGIVDGSGTGSLLWFQAYTWVAVVVGFMNTLLATRHGRREEQSGRRELLMAVPVGRLTPMLATVAVALLANLGVMLGSAAALIVTGLPATGSMLAGLTLALTGLVYFGVGLVIGELAPTARAANGWAGLTIGAGYALRGVGDLLGTADLARGTLTPAWPSALSPIGWGEAVLPYTHARGAPLLLLAAVAVLLIAASLASCRSRELGRSVIRPGLGPARAGRLLGSLPGLNWRLALPSVMGWSAVTALLGLVTPSLAAAAAGALADNPQLTPVFESMSRGARGSLELLVVSAVLGVVALLSAAAGLQVVLQARDEETTGRLEQLWALPMSRPDWIGAALLAAGAAAGAALGASALGLLIGDLARGDPEAGWRGVGQQLLSAPAVALVIAVAAGLLILLPRAAAALAWTMFGLLTLVQLFGGLLRLPDWLIRLNPFTHVPTVPVQDWLPTLTVLAIAVALTVLTLLTARQRQLT